ncbi:lysosomal acid phosphatase-like [Contarinia nasturtii]|uniref:lysosomal acid phosphatase-like n=1 Tax=Contarinia nasturtii TaxID=265458 RepID=UPI0012D37E1E|nr:lysosomal acid phosphatase-like [Contarinia nasturtii]
MTRKLYLMFVLLFVHCGFHNCYLADQSEEQENDQLIFAHVIYRHGDRSPNKSYPNDPYSSEHLWPDGWGQLTKRGMQRQYQLGKYLRKRYYKLLVDGKYTSDKVYIRSSDYDRCILSANANLLGFFPTGNDEVWADKIKCRPIPVHTVPRELDHIVALERHCARYDKAYKETFESPEFLAARNKAERYIKLIMDNSGIENITTMDIISVWDTLRVQYLENLTLPSWTEDMMNPGSDMDIYIRCFYKMFTYTTEMKKLKAGFLLKEILYRCTEKTQSKLSPDRSLWIYSGHDITIANLLNSLGLYDGYIPPFASCLFFELYQSGKDNFNVQLFYKNTTVEDLPPLNPLNIPGCGTKCPLDQFKRLFKDVLPIQNFETECN